MALVIVLIILFVSLAAEQYQASKWKRNKLKDNPNYTNTYLDFFGLDRDRDSDDPRFFGTSSNGDRIMYDKNHNVISNLSKANEVDKFMSQWSLAKERGQKAVELDLLPSESHKYQNQFYAKKKYKDINTKDNYIVITGDPHRGMDQVHYYYDYENKKVVSPSDGFIKRYHDEKACKVVNTILIDRPVLTWDNVLDEMASLQKDIDENGLNRFLTCDYDTLYPMYFKWERKA